MCVCVCVCVCECVLKNVPTQGDKESRMGLTWSLMSSENLMKQLLLPGPSVFFLCSEGSRWRGLSLRPLLLSEVDPLGLLLFFPLRGENVWEAKREIGNGKRVCNQTIRLVVFYFFYS